MPRTRAVERPSGVEEHAPTASTDERTTGEAELAYDTLSSAPVPDGG